MGIVFLKNDVLTDMANLSWCPHDSSGHNASLSEPREPDLLATPVQQRGTPYQVNRFQSVICRPYFIFFQVHVIVLQVNIVTSIPPC